MTEKLSSQLTIPVWAVSVFVLFFIAYMGFFTAQVRAQQQTSTKLESTVLKVDKLEEEMKYKVDEVDMERVYRTLDRIEGKIDATLIRNK